MPPYISILFFILIFASKIDSKTETGADSLSTFLIADFKRLNMGRMLTISELEYIKGTGYTPVGKLLERRKNSIPIKKYKGSVLVFGPAHAGVERCFYEVIAQTFKGSNSKKVVWICIQDSAKRTKEKIGENIGRVKNIWFIDMISRTASIPEDEENTIYCDSPSDYHKMLVSIDRLTRDERTIIVFDNLNAILSFCNPDTLIKVLRTLNNRISAKEHLAVYLLMEGANDPKDENSIQATMDSVLRVGMHGIEVISGRMIGRYKKWGVRNATWKEVLSLEKPLLYMLLLSLIVTNLCLISFIIYKLQ
jgi:hypothetical protein